MNPVKIETKCDALDYQSVSPYYTSENEDFVGFGCSMNTSETYIWNHCMDESSSDNKISTIAAETMDLTFTSTPKKAVAEFKPDVEIQSIPEFADSKIFDISGEEPYSKQIPDYANSKIFDGLDESMYGGKVPFRTYDFALWTELPLEVEPVVVVEKPINVQRSERVLRSRTIKYK